MAPEPRAASNSARLPPPRLALALSLVSASALAYEILLTRLFSIIAWHHFAYMMISVALLGYGAAGTCVALFHARLVARLERVFAICATLFAISASAAFLLAERVPFNALEFLWDPVQPLWLALIYLLLFVPFFFAALCVCLMFTCFAAGAGRLYSYDVLGAAAGCVGVVGALYLALPLQVLGWISAAAMLAGVLAMTAVHPPRWRTALGGVLAAGVLAWALGGPAGELRISPYKEISQALQVMGTQVVAEASSPLGLVSVLASPQVPFRHAPGLSLGAPGGPGEQLAVFIDGEGMSAIEHDTGARDGLVYLDYLTSAAAYHLLETPRVLVLGAGTGSEILQARYHAARTIDAVELNPQVVGLVEREFGDFSGRPYSQPGVRVHVGEARGFVAATPQRYDLIQLALIDAFGASSAGMYALSESYLYTVESLRAYLRRLNPGGYLSITRWVSLPPRDTLKLFGMAAVALEQAGVAEAGRHMALLRGWKTTTLLIKQDEFTPDDSARLRAFCRERSFDLAWYPGMPAAQANRYNRLDRAWFHDGAVALLGAQRAAFIARYKFNIAPATDDRPYFFRFFRWRTLPELWRLKAQGGMPLLEWGYPLVVATLVQAVLASVVLIALPLWWLRRRRRGVDDAAPWACTAVYFAAIGMAFMFIEMAFIQKFVLFLRHPLYAVAVVLFAFLLSAGLGSRTSERLSPRGPAGRAPVLWPVGAIVVLSAAYLVLLPHLVDVFASWSDAGRIALSVALIFPLGFVMGMPFPLGISAISAAPGALVPWAWGVNACASVVSAVLATLLAIHLGFNAVIVLAMVCYGVAALGFAPARVARSAP